MFSYKIVFVAFIASLSSCIEGGVLAPAVAPAIPAPISYHHAIPYNVPPYSDRTDIFQKYVSFPAVPAIPAPVAVPAVPALPAPVAIPAVPHAHALPVPHAHALPAYGPVPLAYGHPAGIPAGYPGYPAAAYSSYDYGAAYPVPVAHGHGLPAPFLRR